MLQLNPKNFLYCIKLLESSIPGGRTTYHVADLLTGFTSVNPPLKEGKQYALQEGNRDFFLEYRKNVLSKYMPPMYKWGEHYDPYTPHPKLIISHRKQRWEEMYSRPTVNLTFSNKNQVKQIEDFYLLCQFERQYYNDYTGHVHPLDYFQRDEYKWATAPDFNSMFVQYPEMYVKYRQPVVLPLTTKKVWIEPYEPSRRLAGKFDLYPDLKFPR